MKEQLGLVVPAAIVKPFPATVKTMANTRTKITISEIRRNFFIFASTCGTGKKLGCSYIMLKIFRWTIRSSTYK
jgi:hypothetical protein